MSNWYKESQSAYIDKVFGCFLDWVVKESFSAEVTLEDRDEWNENRRVWIFRGKASQPEATARPEDLSWDCDCRAQCGEEKGAMGQDIGE